jgi:uncharacterized membrane protein
MRKLLFIFAMMVYSVIMIGQSTATLRISDVDLTGKIPGDKVYVSLYIDEISANQITGWQFFIAFDHSVISWDGTNANPGPGIHWLNPKFPNSASALFNDNGTELVYLWGDGSASATAIPVEQIIEFTFTYLGGETDLTWGIAKSSELIKSSKGVTEMYDENFDYYTLTLIDGAAILPNFNITFTVTDAQTTVPIAGALVTVGTETIATDANGQAVFSRPNGNYSYTVTNTGYINKSGNFNVTGAPVAVNVVMYPTGSEFDITFHVTDGTNNLQGAMVTVGSETLYTNASGEAIFPLPNGNYSYDVSKYGFIPANGSFNVSSANQSIEVQLTMLPHYNVTFHVTTGGNNLEGASVEITGVETLITDINGNAIFSLIDGDYDYTITKTGYAAKSGTITVAGVDFTVEESLSPFYDVTFHTTENGVDLQGVTITVGTESLVTNATGNAVFSLQDGDYSYSASKSGYDVETGNFTVSGANIIIELPMNLITYEVTFNVSSGGNVIEGALVMIGSVSILTNSNGIAIFNLPDGEYEYTVTKEGYNSESDIFTIIGSNLTINVIMTPVINYYDVTFHVTSGGSNIEGALVNIGSQSFLTDSDGIAVFTLLNGTYNYSVTKPLFNTVTGTFTVSGSNLYIEIDLVVTTYDITFHVTSAGANLEGALVTVGTQQVTTNASGIAVFSLPDGNYTYTITKTNYITQSGPLTVAGAPQTIEINMPLDTQVVTFHIVSTGGGLAGVNVTCNGQTVVTDANGNAVFNLFNGTYDYIAEKPGYITLTGSITVNNAPLIKNLIMFPITVTFVVTNNSQPIQDAVVTLTGFPPLTTPANGTVVFSVVPNGTYAWTVTHPDYGLAEGDVTVNNANVTVPVMLVGVYDFTSSSFNIYPNPSNGTFNITTTAFIGYESDITVFDLTGKLVYTGKLQGNDVNVIDLSAQEKGMYILQIIVEDKVYNKTLVIQ